MVNIMIETTWSGYIEASFPKLEKDLECDVLVIGGGICGILCAYYLKKEGKKVILLEADKICRKKSLKTTATITAIEDLMYYELINELGMDKAKLYLEANLFALNEYRKLAAEFDFDFEECVAVFAETVKLGVKYGADAIFIETMNDSYEAKAALLAGKNVLLEKPFCPEVSLAKELKEIAREKGLLLVDMVPTAFLPNLPVLKEQLQKIGRIRMVMGNYTQYSSRYDRFRQGEADNVFTPEFAGGALMDINFYNVYLNTALFGKAKSAHYFPNIQRGIDTSGTIVLQFDGFVSQNAGAKDCRGENFFQIEGEDGHIYIPGGVSSLEEIRVVTKAGTEVIRTPHETDLWGWEVKALAQMITGGNTAPLTEGLETMVSVIETIESARKAAGIRFPGDQET